ncbi:MAG: hypothetical protein WBA68_09650 [Alteraurantiacibacter sp.]
MIEGEGRTREAGSENVFCLLDRLSSAFEGHRILGPKIAILMTLYRAERGGYVHTATSLSRETEFPHATVLRHVNDLIDLKWIMKAADQTDQRVSYLRLMPNTIARIDRALISWVT